MIIIKQPFINPKMMGERIRQLIRAELYQDAESTKAELAQNTGISFPTISKVLDEMNDSAEVLLTGIGLSSGGRRPRTYKLNPDYMTGLAVYLEKDFTSYSLLNYVGDVLVREEFPAALQAGPELLTEQINTFLTRYPSMRVLTLGIPGAVDNGRAFHIPGYERFRDFSFKAFYEERFPLRVQVENDMNTTVFGYYDRTGSDDSLSLVYLYLGKNGPGAGIMVNGHIVRGKSFFSGEVSYVPVSDSQNFGQMLDAASETYGSNESRSILIEAISRLIVSFAATLNPHAVIFSSSELTATDLVQIRQRSALMIPEENLPDLVSSDWEQDYVHGLHRLTVQSMMAAD
ncbi:ROK family protein [Paenibacillus sp. 32352]|uniref:ROK family protein n=1 Tax=Paenibacillus sp. 32352 TaxID=1969111 RepID=UPI0009AC5ADD|nr:ROK family protein [Paenibacillus sp. 32352]